MDFRCFKKTKDGLEYYTDPVKDGELIVKSDNLRNIYTPGGRKLDYLDFIEVYADALCRYLDKEDERDDVIAFARKTVRRLLERTEFLGKSIEKFFLKMKQVDT